MRIHKLSISIALLTVLLGWSIACSKHASDDAIAKDIQTKVAADPETKDSDVSVAAKDGKVTLSGKVKTPAAQKKVNQIAQEEPGITGVEDQTSTPETEAAMAPAPPPVEKPKPQPIVVPAGTALTVRVGQALGSKTSQTGQTFLPLWRNP